MNAPRDHGGGIDAAVAEFGGERKDWLDLSTGINPLPYPLPELSDAAWNSLPDSNATLRLANSARDCWGTPETADIVAACGASAIIALLPLLVDGKTVSIPSPTYNEHAGAFEGAGWQVFPVLCPADVLVLVHPNNPDGRLWNTREIDISAYKLVVIDESFCDVAPEKSLIALAKHTNVVILKSFGKFWGLAGLRLGFVIATGNNLAAFQRMLGPWPASGIALEIGAEALADTAWNAETRERLKRDAMRLDAMVCTGSILGGTSLFRLYDVENASDFRNQLAKAHIWSRVFPYASSWIRLGLPGTEAQWTHLETTLRGMT